jgi:uncharacterized membrane protein
MKTRALIMYNPIIQEVRDARDSLVAKFNLDMEKIAQQPSSSDRAIRASRLLHVSAATFLCVLAVIVVGAIIDIVHNGNSGYPNFWRQVREPFGYLIVSLLFLHGAILGAIRQLGARALALSFVLVLAWLILEPLWPRT